MHQFERAILRQTHGCVTKQAKYKAATTQQANNKAATTQQANNKGFTPMTPPTHHWGGVCEALGLLAQPEGDLSVRDKCYALSQLYLCGGSPHDNAWRQLSLDVMSHYVDAVKRNEVGDPATGFGAVYTGSAAQALFNLGSLIDACLDAHMPSRLATYRGDTKVDDAMRKLFPKEAATDEQVLPSPTDLIKACAVLSKIFHQLCAAQDLLIVPPKLCNEKLAKDIDEAAAKLLARQQHIPGAVDVITTAYPYLKSRMHALSQGQVHVAQQHTADAEVVDADADVIDAVDVGTDCTSMYHQEKSDAVRFALDAMCQAAEATHWVCFAKKMQSEVDFAAAQACPPNAQACAGAVEAVWQKAIGAAQASIDSAHAARTAAEASGNESDADAASWAEQASKPAVAAKLSAEQAPKQTAMMLKHPGEAHASKDATTSNL